MTELTVDVDVDGTLIQVYRQQDPKVINISTLQGDCRRVTLIQGKTSASIAYVKVLQAML